MDSRKTNQENISDVNNLVMLSSQEEALDFLLNKLKSLGFQLDGKAIIIEDATNWDNDFIAWYFSLGTNTNEKFTAENYLAVTKDGELFEYNVLNNNWNLLK